MYQKVDALSEEEVTKYKVLMPLEEQVVMALQQQNKTICCAESCTGGLLSATLINVAGASDVLMEGYVTYSNEAKHRLLQVSEETLQKKGAVSYDTAAQMAYGAAQAAHASVACATTGIAGPGGGTKEKPVGLVYMACFLKGKNIARRFIFKGDRKKIREQSATEALKLVCGCLREYEKEAH